MTTDLIAYIVCKNTYVAKVTVFPPHNINRHEENALTRRFYCHSFHVNKIFHAITGNEVGETMTVSKLKCHITSGKDIIRDWCCDSQKWCSNVFKIYLVEEVARDNVIFSSITDNKFTGTIKQHYTSGNLRATLQYKDGVLHGTCVYYKDKKYYVEYYGPDIDYRLPVERIDNFTNGVLHGIRTCYEMYYYREDYTHLFTKKTFTYNNGKLHGKFLIVYTLNDVVLQEGFYENDHLEGKWITRYTNNKIENNRNYKNGKLHGEQLYYTSYGGFPDQTDVYENGELKTSPYAKYVMMIVLIIFILFMTNKSQ